MVLAQLGGSISRALQNMNNSTVIDERVLHDCLNEINRALLQADVQFDLIRNMHSNIKNIVNLDRLAVGHNKRKIIQQAVFDELCKMLDPTTGINRSSSFFVPKKGKTSVVMFVGLQDTFRAGAFDQLKQNATKANIPFYGSYTESDPVKIAVEGVNRFKEQNCNLIIVDTSGRHKQEVALFEEMRQLSEATKPDLVIFVMDSSIGQAAFGQAQAFKQSVDVGAVIITKLDGHAKGGGSLSAVAATKSHVIFLGTGEHIDEFEVFEVRPFVSRLLGVYCLRLLFRFIDTMLVFFNHCQCQMAFELGMGDLSGLMDRVHKAVPVINRLNCFKIYQKETSPSGLCMTYFIANSKWVLSTSAELMPKGSEKENQRKVKGYMTMMDSMTNKELDSSNPKLMNESRMMRIARGSGHQVKEVLEMMEVYKSLAKMTMFKMPKGNMSALSSRDMNVNLQQMGKTIPPQILKQLGGIGGLQTIMKNIGFAKR
ncbi:hypothetical protein TSUD_389500 [Trifolium subterraneum]|uniref:signal-recognition-particle GTPase n=1 Tax=Trifolium subterraneum TaxID=3900 RepID=A0A2Z6NTD5_TRISU|nr:hypothetical protein TSUD_389500 [Trifolium subterraneum]